MDASLGILIPAYRPDVDRLVSYVGRLDDHLSTDRIHVARALLVARHRARRLQDSPLHRAIAARRDGNPALVDRSSPTTDSTP